MGHQIRFFLGPNDLSELETRLRSVEEMAILYSRSPKPEPKIVDSISFTENGALWALYLARASDLPDVKLKHVPAQGYWVVENLFSPVVEVSRCYYDGKVLKQGRLYYTDGFYDDSEWVEKPPAFTAWAKRLFTAARKTLKNDKELMAYVGSEAMEMRARGVVFKSVSL